MYLQDVYADHDSAAQAFRMAMAVAKNLDHRNFLDDGCGIVSHHLGMAKSLNRLCK
ncbi:MAG TPA: hypothetical protein VKR32_19050 [Puia sp.]|nr:hypothetical protein [Puia sp.]